MINCICVVQQGQSPDNRSAELKGLLNHFSSASFGDVAEVAWIPVAPGNGFTAGKPSTSSVVSFTSGEALQPEHRETLLRELVALWTDATGCSVDEIVAVIADPASH